MSFKERYYVGKGNAAKDLSKKLEEVYRIKGYEVQTLPSGGNVLIVQIRKEGALRTVTGTSESTSVYLEPVGQDLRIRLGEAKWVDKAGAGAVGMLVLWPLAVTAGIGAYRQSQLGKEIWTYIDSYLGYESISAEQYTAQAAFNQPAEKGTSPGTKMEGVQSGFSCPHCDGFVPEEAKFCPHCGSKAQEICAGCQYSLQPGMKFCPNCGKAASATEG